MLAPRRHPAILRVRRCATDFFDHTPIAEIEIDQAALIAWRRLPPSHWKVRRICATGIPDLPPVFLPLAPVTFTDHANPGVTMRAFRLRKF